MPLKRLVPSVLVLVIAFYQPAFSQFVQKREKTTAPQESRTPAHGAPLSVKSLDAEGLGALLGRHGGRNRPLVLFLFYTACRPCTEQLPALQRVADELGPKGLDFALVSIRPMDDEPKVSVFLKTSSIHIPAFLLNDLDDDVAEEFFLPDWEATVPSVFFYDRSGRLVTSATDADTINYDSIRRHALALLATAQEPGLTRNH